MLKSISSRLITLFICVTALVFLTTSIIFLYLFSNYAYTEKRDMLINSANSIANFAVEQYKDSEEGFTADFSAFAEAVLGSSVWICNSDGFFATELGSAWPQTLSQLTEEEIKVIEKALSESTDTVTECFSKSFGESTLTVCVPIRVPISDGIGDSAAEDGKGESLSEILEGLNPDGSGEDSVSYDVRGAVILHAPLEAISRSYMKAQLLLMIVLVIAIALAIFVAITFSIRFTKPIKTMRKAASQMAAGDYDVRVQLQDKSELSELAYSLNHLAATTSASMTKLKNETLKLTNIINNVSDGLAAYDTSLRLVTYNTALLKLCKDDYFQKPEIKEAMLQVMEDGQMRTVMLEEHEILRFTINQIKANDSVEGIVVIVSDVSQSERLERLRREFVANVSHEFRTPLTIIQGSVEVLLDGVVTDPDELHTFYERINTETAALSRLVRDLLDTSRFKAGKNKLKLARLDIKDLLTSLTDSLQTVAKGKDIHLIYERTDIPDLWADYDRIRQLIIIFVDNAIKFTPEGGFITVSTYYKDDMGYLCFKDTGVGMNQEDIPFIFERFYKVDKARGGSETGTGLGLSIAGQIVELHGGNIKVESELGKGTTFKVALPLYNGQDKDLPEGENGPEEEK